MNRDEYTFKGAVDLIEDLPENPSERDIYLVHYKSQSDMENNIITDFEVMYDGVNWKLLGHMPTAAELITYMYNHRFDYTLKDGILTPIEGYHIEIDTDRINEAVDSFNQKKYQKRLEAQEKQEKIRLEEKKKNRKFAFRLIWFTMIGVIGGIVSFELLLYLFKIIFHR